MAAVFFVVGDTARNPGLSGIQTVVRSLARAFAGLRAPIRPVIWNARHRLLRPLPPELSVGPETDALRDPPAVPVATLLRQPGTWLPWLLARGDASRVAIHRHPLHHGAPPGTWVLLPELMYKGKARLLLDYVHRRDWRLAVIFHDAIPVDYPEFVPPALPAQHDGYMRALSEADLILPASRSSAEQWEDFVTRENLRHPPTRTCTLACDLVGTPRVRAVRPAKPAGSPIRVLCVSTVEPRKNHRVLLAAYERAVARRPDLRLELDLVGAPYAGAPELAAEVRAAAAQLPGLRWHEQVEYARLRELYDQCDFTVYPSLVEGFGLPVIESLWLARPCVCANFGVMAENAVGGGCLTVDVREADSLAAAMLDLEAHPDLRARLTAEAIARPLKTWAEYGTEVLRCLGEH